MDCARLTSTVGIIQVYLWEEGKRMSKRPQSFSRETKYINNEREKNMLQRRERMFHGSKEWGGTPSPSLNVFTEVRMKEHECLESMKGVGLLKILKSHRQLLHTAHEWSMPSYTAPLVGDNWIYSSLFIHCESWYPADSVCCLEFGFHVFTQDFWCRCRYRMESGRWSFSSVVLFF